MTYHYRQNINNFVTSTVYHYMTSTTYYRKNINNLSLQTAHKYISTDRMQQLIINRTSTTYYKQNINNYRQNTINMNYNSNTANSTWTDYHYM